MDCPNNTQKSNAVGLKDGKVIDCKVNKEMDINDEVKPIFKVGDEISKAEGLTNSFIVTGVNSEYYSLEAPYKSGVCVLPVNKQDEYVLVNMVEDKEPEPKAPILSNRYDYAEGKCGYVIPDGYEFDCIKEGFQTEIILKPHKETNVNKDNHCEIDENKVLGYKVDDVVFTNDTGWIRITNKLWDCYAKEHVYEGIGLISVIEYKNIRHHDVTGKLQLGVLKYSNNTDGVRCVNNITDDIMINQITNKVSVIELKPDVCDNEVELQLGDYEIEVRDGKTYAILKKPTYPKTYDECCDVLDYDDSFGKDEAGYSTYGFMSDKLRALQNLLVCRKAYWKIAGEEMGLGKPWEPDWTNKDQSKFVISIVNEKISFREYYFEQKVLAFPTEEMRDGFKENFKDLIEQCKELL